MAQDLPVQVGALCFSTLLQDSSEIDVKLYSNFTPVQPHILLHRRKVRSRQIFPARARYLKYLSLPGVTSVVVGVLRAC